MLLSEHLLTYFLTSVAVGLIIETRTGEKLVPKLGIYEQE